MAEPKENKPVKLEAKVKANVLTGIIVAFAGHEYVKTEFRPVPQDEKSVAQALKHEMLEVREVGKKSALVQETEPEPDEMPAKAKTAKK